MEVQEDAEDDEQMANLSKKQRMKLKKQQKLDKKLDIASKKNFGIYEDVIGGQGVRFKYRQTEANTYGLTMEEILFADDKELNQWCSLKKSQQFEDDRAEREYFEEKGKDMRLKQRIFKSLYGTEDEKKRIEQVKQNRQEQKKKKRKNKNKRSNEDDPVLDEEAVDHMEPDAKKVKLDQPEVPKTTSEDRLKAKFTGQSQARSRKGKNSSNRVGKRWAGRDNRPGHKSTSKNNRNNKEWGVHDERLKAYGVNLTKDYKSKQSQSSKKNKPKNQ